MTTRAVLFDFYGTLARAVAWGASMEEVLAGHGLVVDPEARRQWNWETVDGTDHAEHSVDLDTYVAWERAHLRCLVVGCGAPEGGPLCEAVVDDLYAAMKSYTIEAYGEVPGVLRELRDRGVTVAVCSNWDWHLDRALEAAGLTALVDVAVTSAQAGARKPHPRIYEHTLARCGGVDPADALFVGDTWGPDVEGPSAVGLRAVLVCRDGASVHPFISDLTGIFAKLA